MRPTTSVAAGALALLAAAGLPASTAVAASGPASGTAATRAAAVPPVRPALAAPTGRHRVGNVDLHLVDRHRADPYRPAERRELMATVWYPAATTGGPAAYVGPRLAAYLDENATPGLGLRRGQVDWQHVGTHASAGVPAARLPHRAPVLLYSSGGYESRAYGSGEAADLASHGYVVVTVDHTYETPVEFPDGLRSQLVQDAGDEAGNVPVLRRINRTRVADNRFVLDTLRTLATGGDPDVDGRRLPRGLAADLDLGRIGLVGHSAGGDAAAETMHEDRRVDAAVDLDGFLAYDFSGRHPLPAARHGLDRPFLLMGSRSATAEPGDTELVLRSHHSSPAWASLWRHSSGWKRDIGTPLGHHHVFTDHLALLPQLAPLGVPRAAVVGLIGTVPRPARALRSEHTYVRAFFDQHLRHVRRPVLDGPTAGNPDVVFVR